MKKFVVLLLSVGLLIICASCTEDEKVIPDTQPQIDQMQTICDLAVMECYYRNVAKFDEENASGILFWKRDKKFWVEYSGIVKLGIDASQIDMEIHGDTVTITIPEATVLNCSVDSDSITEDSFVVEQGSAKITAKDEQEAFAEAQKKMEESAKNDQVLLRSAQQRAQTLLEEYVKNIGEKIGKNYTVQWGYS